MSFKNDKFRAGYNAGYLAGKAQGELDGYSKGYQNCLTEVSQGIQDYAGAERQGIIGEAKPLNDFAHIPADETGKLIQVSPAELNPVNPWG